jgi:predicted DNA-binding WGR domain protein
MGARRFEFKDRSSSKFWTVQRRTRNVVVTFGRIGSVGQERTKSLPDAGEAAEEVERLIAEKLRKGYAEVNVADEDDGETPPPPRRLAKAVSWEAIAKTWFGARARRRKPSASYDAAAVAKALGIRRLPPSYLAFVDRFGPLHDLRRRYAREGFPGDLGVLGPRELAHYRELFLSWLDVFGLTNVDEARPLLPFGRDTSRVCICWDPAQTGADGEMQICFYSLEHGTRVRVGRDLREVLKYFKPGPSTG